MGRYWSILARVFFEALNSPLRSWASQRIVEAFIGVKRTYVELEDGWCGVSLTPYWKRDEPRRPIRLFEETPRSLARRLEREENSYIASLAIASINATTSAWIASTATPQLRVVSEKQNVLSVLGVNSSDYVVVLGYMRRVAYNAKRLGASVLVADLDRDLLRMAVEDGFTAVPGDSPRILEEVGKASVVVFSGSSLLEPELTLEEVKLAKNARIRLLIGATSSFHPLIAEKLGFNALAGVWLDPRICLSVRNSLASGLGLSRVGRVRIVEWLWFKGLE